MNHEQAETLRGAWMRGVPQAFGRLEGPGEALCAVGVLSTLPYARMVNLEQRAITKCPECGANDTWTSMDRSWRIPIRNEITLIIHYNNDHHFDFLTIANKLEEVTP